MSKIPCVCSNCRFYIGMYETKEGNGYIKADGRRFKPNKCHLFHTTMKDRDFCSKGVPRDDKPKI